jgi:hypothetical protein
MVRWLNYHVNLRDTYDAAVPEQLSIDCSSDCPIAQIDVMSIRPPFRGALLITHQSSIVSRKFTALQSERGRPAC